MPNQGNEFETIDFSAYVREDVKMKILKYAKEKSISVAEAISSFFEERCNAPLVNSDFIAS